MPGLVKVGFSTKAPMLRAKELANTGAPHPYEVLYDALVEEPRMIEASAHALLESHREGREWFRCSVEQAIQAIRQSVGKILSERSYSSLEKGAEFDAVMAPHVQCYYADCSNPVVRTYKGRFLCADHDKAERRSRFGVARIHSRLG